MLIKCRGDIKILIKLFADDYNSMHYYKHQTKRRSPDEIGRKLAKNFRSLSFVNLAYALDAGLLHGGCAVAGGLGQSSCYDCPYWLVLWWRRCSEELFRRNSWRNFLEGYAEDSCYPSSAALDVLASLLPWATLLPWAIWRAFTSTRPLSRASTRCVRRSLRCQELAATP